MKLKKEFQISLWEDFMDTKTNSSNEIIGFINERKICDIASDSLNNPRAAYNIVFKSKTDGTHTLSFDMTSRYWDQDEQAFVDNPMIKYLYNEAKIKLKYKDKWYDLIIKNCQENSKEKKYSYTCEDLFIDELGRNGYNVEFSTELGGNVNTVTELADEALKGSDWTVDKDNSVTPIQKISEPVYAFTFISGEIGCREINEDGQISNDGTITITASTDNPKTIFICHSSATNNKLNGVDYQFYYNENGYYETDEDGNFINTKPKYLEFISDELKDPVTNTFRIQYSSVTHTFTPQYRGYRYVRSPKTEWLSKIKRQVTVYKDAENKEYYGYKKTTYLSPEIAHNLLINSKPSAFNGGSGWVAETTVGGVKKDCLIEMTLTTKNDETLSLSLGAPSNLRAYYFNGDIKEYPTSPVKFTNLAFKNNLKNIGAITKGDRFVVRLKQKWSDSTTDPITNSPFLKYDNDPSTFSHVESFNRDDYYYIIYQCNRSFSYKELLNSSIENGIRFEVTSRDGTFRGGELFRYYTYTDSNSDEHLITPETEVESQTLIKNEYYYFTKEQYKACTNEDDLQMSFKSDEELEYVYRENQFEKIATLEIKESNYFNIIQTLNEKFECWAKFEIDHEKNGAISVDAAGKRIKKVNFCDYIGRENFAGFKYGINLDSIQRTVDSKEITTKTIVKANSNEFAPNGSCNIARASQNPSGAQFILNLDYFTHQKVLKQFEVDNDLYLERDGYLGYYTKLKRLNDALQEIEEQLIAIKSNIIKADRDIQAANVNEEDFLEDINNVNTKLANNYISVNGSSNKQLAATNPIFYKSESENDKYGNVYKWCYHLNIIFYKVNEEDGSAGDAYLPGQQIIYNVENGRKLVDTYNNFIESRFNAINNKRKLEENKAFLIAQRDGEYSYVDVDGNPRIIKYKNGKWYEVLLGPITEEIAGEKIKINPELETDITIITETTDIEEYIWNLNKLVGGITYDKIKERLSLGETLIDSDLSPDIPINQNLQPLLPSIKQLDSQFYSKYSRFIREGTWTSEDYTDDNLYYLDACSVAYTSAFPKTTYSISVVDIKNSIVPDELGYDYSAYDFECGDFTTMEDTEFFGWKEDGITPYKEKIIISETEEHLDNISANKITVQNYKTQFDELFQRITAATQTLELKQGEYERASKVVNVNGEINKTFLQNTLYNNRLIIENVGAQEVIWGDEGIITTDLNNPLLKTRIVGGGIVITEDNGKTWSTGISGQGINASMIRTGQLDVGKVHIMNGNDISFTWNEYGISGFDKNLSGGYDYSRYTRMDRFGFYAVDGTVDYKPISSSQIWDGLDSTNQIVNIPYCLTKDGLRLGMGKNSIRLKKDEDNNNEWTIFIGENTKIVNGKLDIDFGELDMKLTAKNIKFTEDNGNEITNVVMGTGDYAIRVVKDNSNVFSVNYDGYLVAKSGVIGNWNLDSLGLTYNLPGVGEIRIGKHTTKTNENAWISITENGGQSYHFLLKTNGRLKAMGAEIDGNGTFTGTINATKGNFSDEVTIGGTALTASTLRQFYYNGSGGSGTKIVHIEATSGDLGGWEINKTSLTKGTIGNEGSIHMYSSFPDSLGTVTIANVPSNVWRLTVGNNFGVTNEGTVAASNLIVSGGQIGKSSYGETAIWKFGTATFTHQSYGAMIGKPNYQGVTQTVLLPVAAMYYWSDGNTTTSLDATWAEIIASATSSDRRLKKDIQDINLKYEKMFDNLLPKQYKYKEGKRDHLGFIAQEVEENIKNVGMTALDFAGLVKWDLNNDYSGNYALRYDEFIALNTWQIQKLKTRVSDLETEIYNLKLQLENLQKS